MTLQEAQAQVDQWIKKYGVRYFNELTNMAILAEEVGEVARIISRTYGEQSTGDADPGDDSLADELADVALHLGVGGLADQQALRLARQQACDRAQDQPDHHRRRTVKDRVPRQLTEADANEGYQQPEQGGGVFEQDHEHRRVLARPDGLEVAATALRRAEAA